MLRKIFFLIPGIAFLIGHSFSFAYDDEITHPLINEDAVRKSTLDSFLQQNLAFVDGIETVIADKRVWRWFRQGGFDEDIKPRSLRHFHDPTEDAPWSEAGLDLYLLSPMTSSLIWAQGAQTTDINQFSWLEARLSYYNALMSSQEQHYATTFLMLGQLMHLVSDATVPAHVRNHIHPLVDFEQYLPSLQHYEVWVKRKTEINNPEFMAYYDNPLQVDPLLCRQYLAGIGDAPV